MASHKVLKGVAHNMVQLFFIDCGNLVLETVITARRTGGNSFRVNLLQDDVEDSPGLLISDNQVFLKYLRNRFPVTVKKMNSDMGFVKAAELVFAVDPEIRKPYDPNPLFESKYQGSPYTCSVHITDDRGKMYSYSYSDWMYLDSQDKPLGFVSKKPGFIHEMLHEPELRPYLLLGLLVIIAIVVVIFLHWV